MTANTFLSLAVAFLTAFPLQAENSIDPKAREILEKSLRATGSPTAITKIKSRISKGTIAMPAQGMTLTLEMIQKGPNLMYSKSVIPNIMEVEQGFDGEEGWSKDSIQGIRKLTGAELTQAKESAALFAEKQLLEDLFAAEVLPELKEGEVTYQIVKATSKGSPPKTLFFDQSTGLLAKMITKMAVGPEGEMTTETVLSDYREVDGIQIPFEMTIKAGPQNMQMKFTSITHNAEIDDSVFRLKK